LLINTNNKYKYKAIMGIDRSGGIEPDLDQCSFENTVYNKDNRWISFTISADRAD